MPIPALVGACLTMFLFFVGLSAAQFHSYLFENRGFRALEIGLLLASGFGAGVLSPPAQVYLIRVLGGPRRPLMIMLACAGTALALLPLARGFLPIMALFFLASFSATAISPLNMACTLEAIRPRGHGIFFGIRSLGTLGFMLGCLVSAFFTRLGDLPALYFGFGAAMFLALGVVALEYRNAPAGTLPPSPGFFQSLALLADGQTWRLLAALGALNFANALAIGMQGNYLVSRWAGGQRSISVAWVVSTACEVPLMLFCAWLLKRHGLRTVLALGVAGTAVKLVGLAVAGSLWQYYLALSMHGWFFSGALIGFGVYLDRRFRAEDRPALQALSSFFLQGFPAALAALTAGFIWQRFNLRAVYLVSGALAVAASAYGLFVLREFREEAMPVAGEVPETAELNSTPGI